jgi:hypothetical protein
VLLHAALIASLCGERPLGMRDTLRAGAGVLPVFLRLAGMALLAFVILVGGALLAGYSGMSLSRRAAAPLAYELCAVAGILLALSAWLFCGAVHDHARIRAAVSGEGASRSYLWALGFVTSGGRRAFPLALLTWIAAIAAWAVYQIVASQIAADWMTGVVVSILWGQVLLLVRSLLRVWNFAAAAHLQGELKEQF